MNKSCEYCNDNHDTRVACPGYVEHKRKSTILRRLLVHYRHNVKIRPDKLFVLYSAYKAAIRHIKLGYDFESIYQVTVNRFTTITMEET